MEKHELLYDIIINEKQVRVRARLVDVRGRHLQAPAARRYIPRPSRTPLPCRFFSGTAAGMIITKA